MKVVEPQDRPSISKLRACLVQIEAALGLMMRDYDPVPIHTLLSASKGILGGIHKAKPNPLLLRLDESIAQMVRPGFEAEWRKYEHRASNFLKHADRDPFEELEGVDLIGLNIVEATVCIMAIWLYVLRLPETVLLGLIFVTEETHSFFDYHGYLKESPEGRKVLEQLKELKSEERKLFLLSAFDIAHREGLCAAKCHIPNLQKQV